jgi:hypothetical protein
MKSFYGDLIKVKSGTHLYQEQMLFTNGYHIMLSKLQQENVVSNATREGKLLQKLGVPVQIDVET